MVQHHLGILLEERGRGVDVDWRALGHGAIALLRVTLCNIVEETRSNTLGNDLVVFPSGRNVEFVSIHDA